MKRRIVSILLCLVMALSLIPTATVAAGTNIAEGTGWYLDSDGCLHLTGAISNPSSPSTYGGDKTPWKSTKSYIKSVVVESGASVDSCIHLFSDCSELESADLRGLNTSNVTTMDQMFRNCPKLTTVNLSGLNTSKVTQMFGMFTDCTSLTSVNLGGIDTSKVEEMNYMFSNCSSLTSMDLSGFNTDSLVYMSSVFRNCTAMETINISGLNVAKVTHTSDLFDGCVALKTLITSPNVLQKTADAMMDLSPRGWTMPLGSLITLRYTDANMLKALTGDTVTLSPVSTDVGWYIDADGCLHLTGYIYNPSGADSSKEDNDQKLVPWYGQREKIRSVVAEPGSSINSCRYLFTECENLISVDLRNLDTSGVENMSCVFAGCSKLETVDLSGLDVSAVTRCYHNFNGCYALKTVITKPSVIEKTADQMFSCFNGINATGYPNFGGWMSTSTGYIYKSTSELKKFAGYAITLTPIVACEKDSKGNYTWYLDGTGCLHLVGAVTNPSDGSDSTPWKDYKDKIRTVAVEKGASIDNCNRMFYKCPNLVSADLRGLDTSRVTVMYGMFFGCQKLTTVNLTGLDTSKVTNMNCLFEDCKSLTSVDLSGLTTSSVTSMFRMFLGCESLDIINVTGFDTSHVRDMAAMFSGCKKLILVDVSGFSTAASPDMENMFHYCNSLATLGINHDILAGTADQLAGMATWTNAADNTVYASAAALKAITGKVVLQNARNLKAGDGWYLDSDGCLHIFGAVHNLADEEFGTAPWDGCKDEIRSVVTTTGASIDNGIKLFFRCGNLISADLSHLDTSEVESFDRMFCSCAKLTTVDLSGFDTSNVTNMHSMIAGCGSLTSVDLSGFDTSNVTEFSNMFADSSSLTELDLGNFTTSNATSFKNMFKNCSSLEVLDINGFEISETAKVLDFLTGCTALSEISVNDSVLGRAADMIDDLCTMWGWVNKMTGERYIDAEQLKTIVGKVTLVKVTMAVRGWYLDAAGCLHLTGAVTNNSNDSDATQWKDFKDQIKSVVAYPGSSVTNFNYLFYGCRNLRSVDLSRLTPVSGVTLNYTFANCRNLSTVDISCIGSLWRSTASAFHYTSTLREITASKNAVSFMASELTDISRSWLNANTGDVYEYADMHALSGTDAVMLTRFVRIRDNGWYLDMVGGLHITGSVTNTTEAGGRDATPWTEYKKEITSVVVENNARGIYIHNTAGQDNYRALFSGCSNLTKMDLSKLQVTDTATMDVGNMVLNCVNLSEITADGSLIAKAASELLTLSPVWYQKGSGTAYRSAGELQSLTGTVTLTKDAIADRGEGWYLDNNGCLHIFGEVEVALDTNGVYFPWDIYKEQIQTVVTEEGASVDTCENMFKDCVNLTSADLSHLDTSEVGSMSWMFSGCRSLAHVDVSNFDTTNVEYMIDMFDNCRKLCELDLSSFRAIDDGVWMDGMFGGCGRLYSLKIGNFSPHIAYTEYTFFGCVSLSEIEINDMVLIGFSEHDLTTADQLISLSPVWVGDDGTVYTDANEMKSNRGAVALTRFACDLNNDKKTDAADLTILLRHVAKIGEITDAGLLKKADANGDKVIDAADVTLLAKVLNQIAQ